MNPVDMLFQVTLGMNKKEFDRTAQLMRGPEGWDEPKRCPTCKKELIKNDEGDLFCPDFSIDYDKKNGCPWHRYADGLNYWSTPEEFIKAKMNEDPKFKKEFDKFIKSQGA